MIKRGMKGAVLSIKVVWVLLGVDRVQEPQRLASIISNTIGKGRRGHILLIIRDNIRRHSRGIRHTTVKRTEKLAVKVIQSLISFRTKGSIKEEPSMAHHLQKDTNLRIIIKKHQSHMKIQQPLPSWCSAA